MVKNKEYLKRFEKLIILKKKLSYKESLKLFEAMWKQVIEMGVIKDKNLSEGIDADIRKARILNSCIKNY